MVVNQLTSDTNTNTNNINSNNISDDDQCKSNDDQKIDRNLSYLIKKNIEIETRNIEELFDKTVTGIVELKDDLMRINDNELFLSSSNEEERLRKRNNNKNITTTNDIGVDKFLKKEIEALNAAVQQVNVLPAVLSNGHAK